METVPKGTSLDDSPFQSMNGCYMITVEYVSNFMRFELRMKKWDLDFYTFLELPSEGHACTKCWDRAFTKHWEVHTVHQQKGPKNKPYQFQVLRSDTLSATCLLIAAHFVSIKHAKSGIYTSTKMLRFLTFGFVP